MKEQEPHYRHLVHPKTVASNDFWGQVSRTVNGEAVSEEDIQQIVSAIKAGLNLVETDIVLDVGCGNGALSRYLFDSVAELHGIDFSSYLVEVAKKNFEQLPQFSFSEHEAAKFVASCADGSRYTKALCYGVFPYLETTTARQMLIDLFRRFRNITCFYLGNLPDRDRASDFYHDDIDYRSLLDDHLAAIGVWRSKSQFQELAEETGWAVEFHHMPESFYSSHYRYDAILTRAN